MPDPLEVRQLADDILRTQKTLAELQTRWDALFSGQTRLGPVRQGRGTNPSSMSGRIVSLLEEHSGESFTAAQVTSRVEGEIHKVTPILHKLVQRGRIERRGRGEFGALRQPQTVEPPQSLEDHREEFTAA